MSKNRRRGRDDINPFDSSTPLSLNDVDKAVYGEIADIDSRRKTVRPVGIFDIYPDFSQPRRVLPSELRTYWTGHPHQIGDLYEVWVQLINAQRHEPLDLGGYLTQQHLPPDMDGNEDEIEAVHLRPVHPLERALLEIAQLAISIRQVGLTNPITVVRQQDVYRLETGERRWLAYHLLHTFFPDENWSAIPADVVPAFDVWRQATENSARADLNAIGRARQFSILLMDLLTGRGYSFQPFVDVLEAGLSERHYYAQVADGNEYRIPPGDGEKLLAAMGLKNPVQLRQYRALLRLPDPLWQHADDHNLTEGEIRKLTDSTVTRVTVSEPSAEPSPLVESINKKRRDRIWHYASRLALLTPAEREKALEAISDDLTWLTHLRQAIERGLK